MKLLPESPIEFLAPLSRPPERAFITEVTGQYGTMMLAGTNEGLLRVSMDVPPDRFIGGLAEWGVEAVLDDAALSDTAKQVESYLNGEQVVITARVQPVSVTPFTIEVHRTLSRIPYGSTMSYGDVALSIGRPGAARAVGSGCGRNRVLVIVPCHRVVAAHGLGGFGGAGLPQKRMLLGIEGAEY